MLCFQNRRACLCRTPNSTCPRSYWLGWDFTATHTRPHPISVSYMGRPGASSNSILFEPRHVESVCL